MTNRNLLLNPIWRSDELGLSLPQSIHAVSVSLPSWQDVIGYEEKRPEVINRLQCGYPRFVIHPLVAELSRYIAGDCPSLPFPSKRAAELCLAFVKCQSSVNARIVERDGCFAVATTDAGYALVKAFWQHTGLIVSSRRAESFLKKRSHTNLDDLAIRSSLRRQLAELYDCATDDVFLQPSGMSATFAALRVVMQRTPNTPTVQFGFPYVDTLKLQEKLGHGATLLHDLNNCADNLKQLLADRKLAGCFGEIPGNPLLGSADLGLITPILRQHGIPFIADDVVATPLNVDLTPHADMIATSLTKYLVGTGDAMGGALICNPRSPYYTELKAIAVAQHEELLWIEDTVVLDQQIKSFPERMRKHNQNGEIIAERLRAHPLIEQVWYPKWSYSEAYEAVRRLGGGWGSLITFLPKNAELAAPRLYDHLQICKGPSLGTSFTLACPFTLLAHYTELDWAEACGVPRNLIRLSVGIEDADELWRRIECAIFDV